MTQTHFSDKVARIGEALEQTNFNKVNDLQPSSKTQLCRFKRQRNQGDGYMMDWEIRGEELANCNCNFGCPCQFGVLPSDGTCEAAVVYKIHKGHYGQTSLNGLTAAAVYKWPGPIHEGNGHMQLIIDPDADADQRAALEAIMTGADTEEMATMWFVFGAMSPNRHDTIYAPVSLEMSIEDRVAKGAADH